MPKTYLFAEFVVVVDLFAGVIRHKPVGKVVEENNSRITHDLRCSNKISALEVHKRLEIDVYSSLFRRKYPINQIQIKHIDKKRHTLVRTLEKCSNNVNDDSKRSFIIS
jgi:hypothetical protein